MSDDPAPTHATRWDYLVSLIETFSWQITGLVVAFALVVALVIKPSISLPTIPAWIPGVFIAFVLFAVPGLPASLVLVKWLRTRNWVAVHHINAETDTVEKYLVAPETWASKTIEGPDPHPVNEGRAWLVREFEYVEDAAELYVSGSWPSEINDMELYTSRARIEQLHGYFTEQLRELIGVRELVSRVGLEIQKTLVNKQAEAREKGTMLDPDAVTDAVNGVKDDLPDFDPEDVPSLEDALDEDDAPFLDLSPEPRQAVERVTEPTDDQPATRPPKYE